jgi:hypothetical protein
VSKRGTDTQASPGRVVLVWHRMQDGPNWVRRAYRRLLNEPRWCVFSTPPTISSCGIPAPVIPRASPDDRRSAVAEGKSSLQQWFGR